MNDNAKRFGTPQTKYNTECDAENQKKKNEDIVFARRFLPHGLCWHEWRAKPITG
jgi:hypothetical protein